MNDADHADRPAAPLANALRQLRERWWIVLVCMVLGAAALVLNDTRKVKQYEATSTLLFGTTGTNVASLLNQAASNVSADPQRDQGTTLLLVTSSAVAERVKARLKFTGSAEDLAEAITPEARPDANLIDILALDPDPGRAAELANAFAVEYQAFRRETDRDGLQQGIVALSDQLARTPETSTVQRQSLQDSILALRTSAATTTGGVQVVGRATPPKDAATPRPKRDALLGAILGLAIGAALIFAIDLLDRRLRAVREVEAAYGQTSLIGVPLQREVPKDEAARQVALEPYRILRVSLGQVSRVGRPHVVLVTSAVSGEGKSTAAAGLARAVAFSGQRVALVELDLRRPTFHHQFALRDGAPGLSSVLQGKVAVGDALVQPLPELPTLEVIAAGGIPARSAELLGGAFLSYVLRDLSERFDVIVLDAPPLLPVADTHAVLDLDEIDTVLVVARAYLTTRDEAARARGILHQHERHVFGLVVNGLRDDVGSYDYQYAAKGGRSAA